jgi:hypothetical protein
METATVQRCSRQRIENWIVGHGIELVARRALGESQSFEHRPIGCGAQRME